MLGGGGCAYLLTWCPSCFSFSYLLTPLPYLPTPNPPYSLPIGCVSVVYGQLCACSGQERHIDLLHLAEFQTPTIFDHNFNFHCSIFYRSPKIMKIIVYILSIYKDVSTILIQVAVICGFVYMVISFQSYNISIYIENTHQF